mmetsp:Transcript_172507/g.552992  ORF Transcript_172507/g.552992 Transcript_172507/m.552992 type:complete len:250 (-) Transcript_172507:39-788(-)
MLSPAELLFRSDLLRRALCLLLVRLLQPPLPILLGGELSNLLHERLQAGFLGCSAPNLFFGSTLRIMQLHPPPLVGQVPPLGLFVSAALSLVSCGSLAGSLVALVLFLSDCLCLGALPGDSFLPSLLSCLRFLQHNLLRPLRVQAPLAGGLGRFLALHALPGNSGLLPQLLLPQSTAPGLCLRPRLCFNLGRCPHLGGRLGCNLVRKAMALLRLSLGHDLAPCRVVAIGGAHGWARGGVGCHIASTAVE